MALGWMAREGLKRLDHELEEWRTQAKTCTNDFGKTSDALRLANDTIESGTAAQTREIARNYERLAAIDAKLDRVLRHGQEYGP